MSYLPSATDAQNSPRGGVGRNNVQNSKGLGSLVVNDFAKLPTLRTRDEDTTKHLQVSNIPPSVIADGTPASVTMSGNSKRKEKKTKRQYSVRNKNRPKRPLSAYNLFFRYERERIVRETLTVNGHANANVEGKKTRTGKRVHRKTHGAIGFAELGKRISEAWKSLDEKDRAPLQAEADKEKERYQHQLDAMAYPASNHHAGKLKRGADDLPLEVWDSSPPTHANEKNKTSSNLSKYYDPKRYERNDMEEGMTPVSHHHPGYNYYPPVTSPPGHYPPATYFDYHGCYGNERPCEPSAFVPPHPNGPGSPPGHATPQYPPYFGGYQLPTPNEKGDSIDRNPQQLTAHAFSPPYPTHQYNRHTNLNYPPHCPDKGEGLRRADNWASESKPAIQRDFAFQCEVCNIAVFSTFLECASHEEECAKNNVAGESLPRQKNRPQCVGMSEDGNPGSHSRYKMSPLPNSMQAEAEEEQQAVEAVMMLKKPIEC